jgi:hypothetical protein
MTSNVDQFEEVWGRVQAGAPPSEALAGFEDLEPSVMEDVAVAAALSQAGRQMEVPELDPMWQRIASRIHHPAGRRSSRRRAMVLLLAAAMLLGGAALWAAPGVRDGRAPGEPSAVDGQAAEAPTETLDRADILLEDLTRAARRGSGEEVVDLARALARLRRHALGAGEEVSSLDRLIRGALSRVLDGLSPGISGGSSAIWFRSLSRPE